MRRLALVIFAVGLLAGAYADRVPDDPPPVVDGRVMLAVDLHVHSFLGDGAIAPWNLGREARRRGLDAFALTNHNQVFAARLGRWLSSWMGGALILTGEEVTHPGHHIIAVGIERPVEWRGSPAEIMAAIHAQGGVAIAAHPSRAYWKSFDEQAQRTLDGAEVAHPQIFRSPGGRQELEEFFARANRVRAAAGIAPLAAIGSSDFHTMAMLGRCRTFVFARERSQSSIVAAITEGRTRAFVDGDPPPAGMRAAPVARARWGGIVGWVGLLLVVLIAPPRRRPRPEPENLAADKTP